MTTRTVSGQTYNFTYDSENHLTAVSGAAQVSFDYNGDGQRVVATEGITKTVFVGNYFEWQVNTSQATKYYYSGETRVAMQRGSQGVKYLLGDHLGSASVVLNADGTARGAQGYLPWGEVNFTEGTIDTEYTYSGQYSYVSRFGMAYFNARWFLPELGRFNQPDSIIPEQQQGTIAWDRHAGLNNNPVRYTDPSGHAVLEDGSMSDSEDITVSVNGVVITVKPQDEPLVDAESLPPGKNTPDFYRLLRAMMAARDLIQLAGNAVVVSDPKNNVFIKANYTIQSNGVVTVDSLTVVNRSQDPLYILSVTLEGHSSGLFQCASCEKLGVEKASGSEYVATVSSGSEANIVLPGPLAEPAIFQANCLPIEIMVTVLFPTAVVPFWTYTFTVPW